MYVAFFYFFNVVLCLIFFTIFSINFLTISSSHQVRSLQLTRILKVIQCAFLGSENFAICGVLKILHNKMALLHKPIVKGLFHNIISKQQACT